MELNIKNITKTYANGVRALRNIELCIRPGMFGLLGPNGAGKSTLMRIIATLQEPDSGEVTFGDIDILREKNRVRQVLGYLPQEFGVYPKSSAEELLSHLALLKGITDKKERRQVVAELLILTNLHQHRGKPLGSFSNGMKQRFGIAQALLGKPRLMIVDEPTAGLDPAERVRFHNILADIGEITVVILSTHIVSDVSDVCTDMAIIHEGQMLYQGQPKTAVGAVDGKIWQKTIEKKELEEYRAKFSLISSQLNAGRTQIRIYSHHNPEHGFEKVQSDLKDVYFSVISGCLNGGGK